MKIKTNHIAVLLLSIILLGMLLVAFKLATLTEVSTFGSMLVGVLAAVGFKLSADHKNE